MRVKIEVEVDVPEVCTQEQLEEWVKYELVGGSMRIDNPLSKYDIVADLVTLGITAND